MEEQIARQKQIRTNLWTKATDLLNQAAEKDEQKDYKEALRLFLEAGSALIEARKIETDDAKRQVLRAKLEEVFYCAEKLKAIVDQESIIATQPATLQSQSKVAPEIIPTPLPPVQEQIQKSDTALVPQPSQTIATSSPDYQILANIEGVQCYVILGQGKQLLTEGALRILKSDNGVKSLQIGSVQFPLSQSTPCLKTSNGNYIIPMNENVFYGFIFPSTIPDIYLRIFESLLADSCSFRAQPQQHSQTTTPSVPATNTSTNNINTTTSSTTPTVLSPEVKRSDTTISEKISNGIQTGTTYLVSGIEKTATVVSSGLAKGGDYVKSNSQPAEKAAQVPTVISGTLHVASTVSPYLVKASNIIANGISTAVGVVGSALAEKVIEKLPSTTGTKSETLEAVKTVGSAAIGSVVLVWDALEQAGSVLLTQTKVTTVDIVDHKYGKDAAKTTGDGLSVVLDAAQTAYNIKQVGTKKIIKNTIKETGKQTVKKVFTNDGKTPSSPSSSGTPSSNDVNTPPQQE